LKPHTSRGSFTVEKEVFSRPRRRAEDQAEVDERSSGGVLTKREGVIATLALSVVYVLLRLLEVLGGKLLEIAKVAK
jgi:hypothetical protein